MWKKQIDPSWLLLFEKHAELLETIEVELLDEQFYPKMENIFKVFSLPVEEVKIVILGQDPYYKMGQADGLAFSCKQRPMPPSLAHILREAKVPTHNGDLSGWHKQGVFLLNTLLTVPPYRPMGHKTLGWQVFTDDVIKYVLSYNPKTVFMLWGKAAQAKESLITDRAWVLKTSHPSPLAVMRGFAGCGHFVAANRLLELQGQQPIDWSK